MTGESEDTEVGFPGPDHHVAEREWPMKAAMGTLALLAVIGGVVGIPALTDSLEKFLEPTFEGSRFHETHPSEGAEWLGLVAGGAVAVIGIGLAYLLYVRRPGTTAALQERFGALHDFLAHKWYFDELYELVFVRPSRAAGRFGRTTIESAFVQGTVIGGATGIVRAGSSFARAIQSGYMRAYALLLAMGFGALGLYFLIAST